MRNGRPNDFTDNELVLKDTGKIFVPSVGLLEMITNSEFHEGSIEEHEIESFSELYNIFIRSELCNEKRGNKDKRDKVVKEDLGNPRGFDPLENKK